MTVSRQTRSPMNANALPFLCVLVAGLVACTGCGKRGETAGSGDSAASAVITAGGSDTMVNLAQMWAEAYHTVDPAVSVEVSGGGTGVGIRDLTQGIIQIANCSRAIEPKEAEQVKANTGKDPVETLAGYDGIAVYVHKDNPLASISMQQLAEIFAEGGPIESWSQLGVDPAALGGDDKIIRVSRQNSSGTYLYFREHVLGKKDFKSGSLDMSGSKDVVELVSRTKSAIGYSGMGYATANVKMLPVSATPDSAPVAPSVECVLNHTYALARSLHLYTLGPPEGALKAYVNWIASPAGQAIVQKAGYVPVPTGSTP